MNTTTTTCVSPSRAASAKSVAKLQGLAVLIMTKIVVALPMTKQTTKPAIGPLNQLASQIRPAAAAATSMAKLHSSLVWVLIKLVATVVTNLAATCRANGMALNATKIRAAPAATSVP